MRLPDTNVLVYAVNSAAPQQAVAKRWLQMAFDSPQGVALTWMTLVGFVRLTTHPSILRRPLAIADALNTIDEWLAEPSARVVHPGSQHAALLGRFLLAAGTGGNLTSDAHLAALAIEHGAAVGTFDNDFRRFAGVNVDLLSA